MSLPFHGSKACVKDLHDRNRVLIPKYQLWSVDALLEPARNMVIALMCQAVDERLDGHVNRAREK